MPNFFDQFDPPAQAKPGDQFDQPGPPTPNFFDRFDEGKKPLSWWETARDAYRSIKPGILTGLAEGSAPLGQAAAIEMGQNPESIPGSEETAQHLNRAITPRSLSDLVTGEQKLYEPQSLTGKAVKGGLSFAFNPASYIGGDAGLPLKAITAMSSGAGSAVAGDLAKGTVMEPYAPFLGAVAGGITPTKMLTPMPVGTQRLRDLETLEKEGVTGISAGHKTGNRMMQAAESQLGNVENLNELEKHSFLQAAFDKVGENLGKPGERPMIGTAQNNAVVDSMMNRLGNNIDAVAKRNTMLADAGLGNDLVDVQRQYSQHVAPTMRAPIVDNFIKDLATSPGSGGVLSGDIYTSMRSQARAEARNASDPHTKKALNGIADALDNAMERSIARNNPADAGQFSKAYKDYKNGLILQDWAGGGVQNMTPRTLAISAKNVAGKTNFTRGRTDFDDLADAGSRVLKSFPDSGTGTRTSVEKALSAGGGLLTHALGTAGGYAAAKHGMFSGTPDPEILGAIIGGAGGPFALRGVGRAAVMNPLSQGYLGNQILPKGTTDTMPVWLARALLNNQSNQ
jgi:hypothetical protein